MTDVPSCSASGTRVPSPECTYLISDIKADKETKLNPAMIQLQKTLEALDKSQDDANSSNRSEDWQKCDDLEDQVQSLQEQLYSLQQILIYKQDKCIRLLQEHVSQLTSEKLRSKK